jgi:hypothetical protein
MANKLQTIPVDNSDDENDGKDEGDLSKDAMVWESVGR